MATAGHDRATLEQLRSDEAAPWREVRAAGRDAAALLERARLEAAAIAVPVRQRAGGGSA